jgi:hypothetical protein
MQMEFPASIRRFAGGEKMIDKNWKSWLYWRRKEALGIR